MNCRIDATPLELAAWMHKHGWMPASECIRRATWWMAAPGTDECYTVELPSTTHGDCRRRMAEVMQTLAVAHGLPVCQIDAEARALGQQRPVVIPRPPRVPFPSLTAEDIALVSEFLCSLGTRTR